MKKILLLMLMLQAVTMHSQILLNRNYNALVVGNIASDITGATSGQGAMYAEYSNGVAPTTSSNAAARWPFIWRQRAFYIMLFTVSSPFFPIVRLQP